MNKSDYHRYLASREWNLLKNEIKRRSNGICERCKIMPSSHIHHLTYERVGMERPDDLFDICEFCHQFLHGKSPYDPIKTQSEENTILNKYDGNEYLLICPKCKYDYLHVRRVYGLAGSDEHEGGPDIDGTIYGAPIGGTTPSRRNCLCVEVHGECGHVFVLHFQQHKGQTFVTSRLSDKEAFMD